MGATYDVVAFVFASIFSRADVAFGTGLGVERGVREGERRDGSEEERDSGEELHFCVVRMW